MKTFWKAWLAALINGMLVVTDFVIFLSVVLFLWGHSQREILGLVKLFYFVFCVTLPPAVFMTLLTGCPISRRQELIRDFWKNFKRVNPLGFYSYYLPKILIFSFKNLFRSLSRHPQASS